MLILTRTIGETIKIGDTTDITILEIDDKQVSVGTTSLDYVEIQKEEIHTRSQLEPIANA